MKHSVQKQVKSGLRLGGGLVVFLIAMAPLIDGLRRIVWSSPSHQLLWREPIGWLELVIAAALLASTARVWVQYLAGCMVFACVKGIVMFTVGTPISRQATAGLVFVFLITLVLMVSIIRTGVTSPDRIALTLYVFSLGWSADQGVFMPSPSLAVGLAAMLISRCVYYWRLRNLRKALPRPNRSLHRMAK